VEGSAKLLSSWQEMECATRAGAFLSMLNFFPSLSCSMFKKILIANRGEIAVRILRACRELASGRSPSSASRPQIASRALADEAYPIGPAPSRESYLRIDKLMDVARRACCDAVHPGYGFLAENARSPRLRDAGLTFIGPPPEAMEPSAPRRAAASSPAVPMFHRSGTNDA